MIIVDDRMLVLSSGEALGIARAVQGYFSRQAIEVTVWDQLVFKPGHSLLDTIINVLKTYQWIIVVLSDDDVVLSKGKKYNSPRDNLIFELGAAIASIGPERSFILLPAAAALKLPTDISGLVYASYSKRQDDNYAAVVAPACSEIQSAMRAQGVLSMTWESYGRAISRLEEQLWSHSVYGGFRPHLLIGVQPGGTIVAGFLQTWKRDVKSYSIDPRSPWTRSQAETLKAMIKPITTEVPRILIVDDSFKTGAAMNKVVQIVRETLSSVQPEVRGAVLAWRKEFTVTDCEFVPSYFVTTNLDKLPYAHV